MARSREIARTSGLLYSFKASADRYFDLLAPFTTGVWFFDAGLLSTHRLPSSNTTSVGAIALLHAWWTAGTSMNIKKPKKKEGKKEKKEKEARQPAREFEYQGGWCYYDKEYWHKRCSL
jgi:hypothetical protein